MLARELTDFDLAYLTILEHLRTARLSPSTTAG
jgi:hypothetical protein